MKKLSILLLAVLTISVMGCKKEKLITLSSQSTTLHHGDTYSIPAQCEDPITYSSQNNYVAEVSSSGLITAQYVGNTIITLNSNDDQKSFNVIVSPRYNTYPEPNIRIGETKSSVISKYGTPDYSQANSIAYDDYSNAAPILLVLLENDRVTAYSVLVKTSYSSQLADFLGERYRFVGYSDETFVYSNALTETGTTMYVANRLYNISYWMVAYLGDLNDAKVYNREIIDFCINAVN